MRGWKEILGAAAVASLMVVSVIVGFMGIAGLKGSTDGEDTKVDLSRLKIVVKVEQPCKKECSEKKKPFRLNRHLQYKEIMETPTIEEIMSNLEVEYPASRPTTYPAVMTSSPAKVSGGSASKPATLPTTKPAIDGAEGL